ncbi:ThuA domain-containing protein [Desertivirga brevis]|uniref:ThuA domain-containing protein n=1 Tax=Desertivirga brevis TaxID=2810310 RepID=UPI001A95C7F6|nr:ThuA domain-containing protein [Pedobacter sp. SYSU D00873]
MALNRPKLPGLLAKLSFLTLLLLLTLRPDQVFASKKPLKILLITGGCCHNYPAQTEQLKKAVSKNTTAEWTVINEGGTGTTATISLYSKEAWAKGYDLVVHNECFADTKDPDYIKKITSAHAKGVPAVVIHCAMHTYRTAEIDDWREFLGVTSRRHDHQSQYPVQKTGDHYITKDLPKQWTGPKDELYIIEKVWPNTKMLATSVSERDGKTHPVIWTNKYGKARVFGTTFGHSDEMFSDEVFLGVLARGIIWAAGRD